MKLPFVVAIFCINLSLFKANNLQVGSPTVNIGSSSVVFTLSWDNSWNTGITPNNWDGVWVFIKRQSCSNNLWVHSLVSTVSANHGVSGGVLQVDAVADGMGVFVRRSGLGFGNIAPVTVTIQLQTPPTATENFIVYGIEVVNVPQGDFYLGDGTGGTNLWGFGPAPSYSMLITNAIQAAGIGLNSNYTNGGLGCSAALPSTFPLGWNKFYCMKYEISQEQEASFLNTLTYDQQVFRTAVAPSSTVGSYALMTGGVNSRNSIKISVIGVSNTQPAVYGCDLNNNNIFDEPGDGQNLACNWLSWADLMAYLDWCGLRPMTEFEFEKVCRGITLGVPYNENAWGNTLLLQAESGSVVNPGMPSEVSTASGSGLCAYGANNTAKGPLRCGFAATGSTNRAQAGATYYGVMEMSGNVMEQCVGGFSYNYSAFTTVNGDGSLTTLGAANTAGWPPLGGGSAGGVMRGGDWFTATPAYLNVSDRVYIINTTNQVRDRKTGGRGVRSW